MFQLEVDKPKNLLKMVFAQHVTQQETNRWRETLQAALVDLRPGFKLLNDMSALETMDPACAPDIEFAMELLDKAGIAKVVRVIADSQKDIGFNIMSLFHYRRRIPMVMCETLEEALRALAD